MATRCFLHWPNHLKHFSNRLTVNSLSSGIQATTLFQLQTCTHQASDSAAFAMLAKPKDITSVNGTRPHDCCTLKCKFGLKNCVKMKTHSIDHQTAMQKLPDCCAVSCLHCFMQFSEHNFLKMVMMNHYTKFTYKMFERYSWPLYYWSSLWPWPWSWQANLPAWRDSLGYTIPSLVTV